MDLIYLLLVLFGVVFKKPLLNPWSQDLYLSFLLRSSGHLLHMILFELKHTNYLNSKHDYNTLQGEMSHYNIFQIPAYQLTLAMPVSSQTFELHKYKKYHNKRPIQISCYYSQNVSQTNAPFPPYNFPFFPQCPSVPVNHIIIHLFLQAENLRMILESSLFIIALNFYHLASTSSFPWEINSSWNEL